ncbi:MAG: signal recognition particle protein [Candidatus Neomarinimicrobiota bacterium]|nr:MAG: signal recognition particle protein [Candidatus Neomarinimicrobiota bacterium]
MFEQITDRFDSLFRRMRGLGKITDANIRTAVRDIRRILLAADVNFRVARDFVNRVAERAQGLPVLKSIKPGEQFVKIVHDELVQLLGTESYEMDGSRRPTVVLLAGLQGAGKTTTAAKLAYRFREKKVLVIGADLVRPAAVHQLEVLAKQAGADFTSDLKSTAVEVVRQGLELGRQGGYDLILIDSAGRLHVDETMMEEIRHLASLAQPHHLFFVVDGMTGQDAVRSAQAFDQALELTAVILTKMDGDARGGAAVSVRAVTGKPVAFLGTSEKLDGLEPFDARRLADRILGLGDVITLVEKAQQVVDEEAARTLQNKLAKQTFDLDDFRQQIRRLQKMGSLTQLMGMMPGLPRKALRGLNLDDRQLVWTEALINSMTPEERRKPHIINGSRRKRIARGAGRPVQEINQLLKNFALMQKMVKSMGNKRFPGKPGAFPGMNTLLGN